MTDLAVVYQSIDLRLIQHENHEDRTELDYLIDLFTVEVGDQVSILVTLELQLIVQPQSKLLPILQRG